MTGDGIDLQPPPPPPSSPPPPQETTTIGRYIARFRYESPQPRESRVTAPKGDFWWTRSPRYSRSPSPPSTWASGGIFNFPEDEEEGKEGEEKEEDNIISKTEEEKQLETRKDDDVESVASIENKLRRRLGLLGSDTSGVVGGKREATSSRSVELMSSWGSGDWSSGELEEEDTEVGLGEEEDPEEVIERVRKRLGWATPSSVTSLPSSCLKPIEFRLVLGDEERRRMKPPPSPRAHRSREVASSVGSTFSPSWGVPTKQGHDDKHMEEVTLPASSVDRTKDRAPGGVDAEPRESVGPIKRGEKQSSQGTLYSLVAASMENSLRGTDSWHFEGAASVDDSETVPRRNNPIVTTKSCGHEQTHSVVFSTPSMGGSKDGSQEDANQLQNILGERRADNYVVGPSPLPTTSPARPPIPGMFAPPPPRCSQDSSLISDSPIRGETTNTLNSLVSFVVHSWSKDSPESIAEHKETEKNNHRSGESSINRNGAHSAEDANISANDQLCSGDGDLESEDEKVDEVAADLPEPLEPLTMETEDPLSLTSTMDILVEMPKPKCEEITEVERNNHRVEEGEKVPGEEDDEIVQMLLQRIALLEEALRQIDT